MTPTTAPVHRPSESLPSVIGGTVCGLLALLLLLFVAVVLRLRPPPR